MVNKATAQLNYLRIAPRKARLMANVLRGLSINEAEAQLMLNPRRAAEPILKLLRSAVANAKNSSQNKNLAPEKLIIKEIRVDNGPMLKRFMPRAQGRAGAIQKKMSHIFLLLEESEKAKAPRFKITKAERIKKRDAEKIKAALAEAKAKEKEKNVEKKKVEDWKAKPGERRGFARRIFRRKSV